MFNPRYLTEQQVGQVMEQYKQAAELKVLEAWIAHQCNPGDASLKTKYEAAEGDLAWLEKEEERWASFHRPQS